RNAPIPLGFWFPHASKEELAEPNLNHRADAGSCDEDEHRERYEDDEDAARREHASHDGIEGLRATARGHRQARWGGDDQRLSRWIRTRHQERRDRRAESSELSPCRATPSSSSRK